MTKYGKEIENRNFNLYIDSLKNKTYKLLPLREEKLQWEKHLETILIEISGFNSILILMTRDNNLEYTGSYKKYGFDDYILKPISRNKLITLLEKYFK